VKKKPVKGWYIGIVIAVIARVTVKDPDPFPSYFQPASTRNKTINEQEIETCREIDAFHK